MNILHLISGDLHGGAAKGAYWLHQSLLEQGVNSKVLTNALDSLGDQSVSSINSTSWQRFKNGIIHQIDKSVLKLYPHREKQIFSSALAGYNFLSHPSYHWADIIHLHWINGGMVNVKHLSKIKKPVVWTLRDMWPMTGGCHYSLTCDRYKIGCGKCVQLKSSNNHDLSRINFKRKQKFLPRECVYVGISPWLANTAKESKLLKERDVRMIFNNVSSSEFFPLDKQLARTVLQIDTPKKIILAGAQKITDPYKGFDRFLDAVSRLSPSEYFIVFFGRIPGEEAAKTGLEYKSFGFVHDTVTLRLLYSAADIFVAPSLMDAFGKTLVESLACGTPVVCFDATGPKTIVDHKQNGYKAVPYDPEDLRRGIEWVAHSDNYPQLVKSAREKAIQLYDARLIARQYHQLYLEILNKEEKHTS
ncbi:MAG: glycosyltransferase family 4 protein [Prolixibacteraceae bacterium]